MKLHPSWSALLLALAVAVIVLGFIVLMLIAEPASRIPPG
jgi:hypothetical protein